MTMSLNNITKYTENYSKQLYGLIINNPDITCEKFLSYIRGYIENDFEWIVPLLISDDFLSQCFEYYSRSNMELVESFLEELEKNRFIYSKYRAVKLIRDNPNNNQLLLYANAGCYDMNDIRVILRKCYDHLHVKLSKELLISFMKQYPEQVMDILSIIFLSSYYDNHRNDYYNDLNEILFNNLDNVEFIRIKPYVLHYDYRLNKIMKRF